MIKVIADTHTHTIACDHAYSTALENIHFAAGHGIKFIAMTEHGPTMPDAPFLWYFTNQKVIPDMVEGVIVLKGAETNVMDFDGHLDLSDHDLSGLDWVIASMHIPVCTPGTVEDHTRAWMEVAKNPLVDVIGHSGDSRYAFDYEPVIKAFGENGKIVEINAHSFEVRPGSKENCRKIALLCKKYGVRIVVNSDSHFCMCIGDVQAALDMLEEIEFPEELILNADYDRFLKIAREKSGRMLTE